MPVLSCPVPVAFGFGLQVALRIGLRIGFRFTGATSLATVLGVDDRLMSDLLPRPLVADVGDDLEGLAVVLPPPDVHQFFRSLGAACPAAHVILGELALGLLAVRPRQSLMVQ